MADLELLVYPQDVSDVIKGGIPAEDLPWVANLIARATRLLVNLRPGLPALVDSGAVVAAFVADVIVDAVARVVRNPEGYYREQEGEYGYSKSVASSSGQLEFLPSELAPLTPGNNGVQSVRLISAWTQG